MVQHILDAWGKLSLETKLLVIGQVVATLAAVWRAFRASRKASFFERAHEAVVMGIEHSNCDDCRQAAKAVTQELGIEFKVKPVVKAIKATMTGITDGS